MKKNNWITVLIIVLVIALIGLVIAVGILLTAAEVSKDEEPKNTNDKERQGKFDLAKARAKAIEVRIKSEIALLKLTTEMENVLARKVDRICIAIGVIAAAIVVLVAYAFFASGYDLVTSVLNTIGLFSLTFTFISIIAWKTIDFNSLVIATRQWIKSWLNKKFGHNPDAMVTLTESIKAGEKELSELNVTSTVA